MILRPCKVQSVTLYPRLLYHFAVIHDLPVAVEELQHLLITRLIHITFEYGPLITPVAVVHRPCICYYPLIIRIVVDLVEPKRNIIVRHFDKHDTIVLFLRLKRGFVFDITGFKSHLSFIYRKYCAAVILSIPCAVIFSGFFRIRIVLVDQPFLIGNAPFFRMKFPVVKNLIGKLPDAYADIPAERFGIKCPEHVHVAIFRNIYTI